MEGKVILARLLNSFQVNLQEGYQLKVEQTTTLRPVDGVPCTLVALKWSQGILVTFLILNFPVISSPELVQHGAVCVPIYQTSEKRHSALLQYERTKVMQIDRAKVMQITVYLRAK